MREQWYRRTEDQWRSQGRGRRRDMGTGAPPRPAAQPGCLFERRVVWRGKCNRSDPWDLAVAAADARAANEWMGLDGMGMSRERDSRLCWEVLAPSRNLPPTTVVRSRRVPEFPSNGTSRCCCTRGLNRPKSAPPYLLLPRRWSITLPPKPLACFCLLYIHPYRRSRLC